MYESNTVGSVKEWLSVLTGVHVEQADLRESIGAIRRDRIKTVRDNRVFHPPRNHLKEQSEFARMFEGAGEGGRGGHGIFEGFNSRINERMGAVSPDKRENTLENLSSNLQP